MSQQFLGQELEAYCLSNAFPKGPVPVKELLLVKVDPQSIFELPKWCPVQYPSLELHSGGDENLWGSKGFWSNTHQCRPLCLWDSSPLKHNWIISRCPNQWSFQKQYYNFFSVDFHPRMLVPVTAIEFHKDLIKKKKNSSLFRHLTENHIPTILTENETATLVRKIRIIIAVLILRIHLHS